MTGSGDSMQQRPNLDSIVERSTIERSTIERSTIERSTGSREQQQIPIRILDDEIPGAPGLFFQRLVKSNTRRLKLKKQQLDLLRSSNGHRCRQHFLAITDRRVDYGSLDAL